MSDVLKSYIAIACYVKAGVFSLFVLFKFVLAVSAFIVLGCFVFFFSSRRRHTRSLCDWSSDVYSSDLKPGQDPVGFGGPVARLSQLGSRAVHRVRGPPGRRRARTHGGDECRPNRRDAVAARAAERAPRSEERRVGKERRCRRSPYASQE